MDITNTLIQIGLFSGLLSILWFVVLVCLDNQITIAKYIGEEYKKFTNYCGKILLIISVASFMLAVWFELII